MKPKSLFFLALALMIMGACKNKPHFDVLIKNGTLVDGSGTPSFIGDLGINADTIAAIGNLDGATATNSIDATDLAVAPGFINILSWATESLIEDSRSMGDIKQGVTHEVFGVGTTMRTLSLRMKRGK